MTADDKYSLCYMENIRQTIQMQLSKKETFFPEPFAVFLKSTTKLHILKKKDDLDSLCISETMDCQRRG